MKALLQILLVFVRSQVKEVLKSLEFDYDSKFKSLDFMKFYFSEALKKEKKMPGHAFMTKPQKALFWQQVRADWKKVCEEQKVMAEQKRNLVKALIFWKSIRTIIRDEDRSADEKREFLKGFFNDENKYIQIISIMECLPDVVLKKVLWKANIDFPSFEAFLRRLQPEQEALIRKTYEELFVDQLHAYSFPTVYKNSVRDFFRFCFQMTSAEKEKNSEYGSENRWMTKNAWAFNLLGMDFGFSLYPKGVTDDTKITNQKFTRFLSIKNHINDFIVNQFDGKYWWFYKTARSNYVWMPGKEVKLRDHICPGFWLTLILHAIFWIVSPILFTSVFTHWIKSGHSLQIAHLWPVLVSLIPTPLFVVFSTIRLIFQMVEKHGGIVGKLITGIGVAMSGWYKRNQKFFKVLKGIGIGIIVTIIGAIVLAIASGIMFVIWFTAGKVHLPMSTTVLLFAVAIFHIVFVVLVKMLDSIKWDDYDDVPSWIKITTLFSVILAAINLYDQYVAKSFEKWIAGVVSSTKEFFVHQPFTASLLVFGVFSIIAGLKFLGLSMNEEKFAKRSRFIRVFSIISGVLIIGLVYLANTKESIFIGDGSSTFPVFAGMAGMMALFTIFFSWMSTIKINEETIDIRNKSKETVTSLYETFHWDLKEKKFRFEPKLSFKRLLKNKWLLGLDTKQRVKVIRKIGRTLEHLFGEISYIGREVSMNRFFSRNLALMNKDSIELFRKVTAQIVCLQKKSGPEGSFFRYLDAKELSTIVQTVLYGQTFSDGVQAVKDERERKRVSKEKAIEFKNNFAKYFSSPIKWFFGTFIFSPIAWFFKTIAWPFIWCARKIYQFFATLKDLWALFNKHCPYVTRSKILE